MKVLLVAAAHATSGGGERHVADLLRLLPERGVDVALACPGGGDLSALADSLGIERHAISIASGFSAVKVTAVRSVIDGVRPDIVHAHGSRAAMFARLADSNAGRRVVYTVHGIHADKAGTVLRRTVFLGIERWLRPRTAQFVTVCNSDIPKGTGLGILDPQRTTTVYNGIALPMGEPVSGVLRAELAIGSDAPLALSVGRFHEQKDQATLIRAWRLVVDELPDAVLALIGGGRLEGQLRELVTALGLAEHVRLLSERVGLDAAYDDANVFALSSRWEGLPYVVLEAMAHALPVVTTGVDGIPEAVVDGETGLLVTPQDSPGLAAAISRLLSDAGQRRRMGQSGLARVSERFSLDRMVDGLLGVYATVGDADWSQRAGGVSAESPVPRS